VRYTERTVGRQCAATRPFGLVQPQHAWYVPLKFAMEYIGAVGLFLLAIPVMGIAALIIKLTSRGPVFYRQTRVGRGGRPFRLIKLRTMVHDAEALSGPVWSSGATDPRVTRFGRILRNTHIDEFPQLANVLLGQMILIGPRPERPEFVQDLEWSIPEYSQRLNVRPGITGFAQIVLPPDTDDAGIEGVRRKIQYDLYYIRQMNPWFDFKIAVSTIGLLWSALWYSAKNVLKLPDDNYVNQLVCELATEKGFDAEGGLRGPHALSAGPH
jgi:lipopolysaccharide/colanic/teichoic acid biosynthesis glycosyltransferase